MLFEVEYKIEAPKTKLLILSGVLDYSTAEEFEKSVGDLEGLNKLCIDFSKLRFIDSTGIYALAQVVTKCQGRKVLIQVRNISKPIYEILDVLGLISAFGQEVFIKVGP